MPLIAFFGSVPRALAGRWEQGKEDYWQDGIFKQDNVDMSKYDQGIIRARVDDSWEEYPLVQLDDAFMDWNLESRLRYLQTIAEGKMPSLAGPHAAAVATYGGGRLDSHFSLNNAIKGMGFAPKRERIREMIDRYKDTMDLSMPEKLEILQENYRRPELWDRTKQVSLELYASPDFETHTFLNVMANPVATIVFTDMPSYELRAIVRIVHAQDPQPLPFEKDFLEYSNMAHAYFHGGADQRFNLLAFHIIEQFDNSPGSGRGVRVRPPLAEE
ncbi:hypothetical protein ACFL0G_04720 [Candidatus Zixiibacteriota bacterium]